MDELSKTVMSWLIPFMFGGFIFIIKSPFLAIEKAKDEYTKIITAYIATGRIPSKDNLIELKRRVARKHNIAAHDLPQMETVLDSSYCAYWASEKIDTNKKIPFNTNFSCHKEIFVKNDPIISRTWKDWRRKICLEGIINLVVSVGFAFILLLSSIIADPKAISSFPFLPTTFWIFILSAIGQFAVFVFQKAFNYFFAFTK